MEQARLQDEKRFIRMIAYNPERALVLFPNLLASTRTPAARK